MLVPMRTSVDLRRRNEQNNELYQLKVDVGMLNTVKNYLTDVQVLALRQSKPLWLWRRANARNVSSLILHGVQHTYINLFIV